MRADADPSQLSESIRIPNLTSHITDADFVPVKIGDVSNQHNRLTTYDARVSYAVVAQRPAPSEHSYRYILNEAIPISGLQFSIDLRGFGLKNVESQLPGFTTGHYNLTDEDILNVSWIVEQEYEADCTELFTIHLRAEDTTLMSGRMPRLEVYRGSDTYVIEQNEAVSQNEDRMSNLLVYPNPANAETTISFDSPSRRRVNYSIYSIEGELIHHDYVSAIEGSNKVLISPDLGDCSAGLYLVRITDHHTSLVEKIIVAH